MYGYNVAELESYMKKNRQQMLMLPAPVTADNTPHNGTYTFLHCIPVRVVTRINEETAEDEISKPYSL